METLQRLLGSLYRAVDANPQAQLAMRVRHNDGAHWSVTGNVLRVNYGDDPALHVTTIALRGTTIDDVADALVLAGYTVPYQNSALAARDASILIAGAGNENESDGDHLYAYTSLTWALESAFGDALDIAQRDGIVAGIRQAYLHSAEGEWLDLWGGFFGLPREPSETDAHYVHRIVVEVLRPRVNAFAIQQAIFDLTGVRVTLREPWREIFTLDVSQLSGTDHLQDGNFFTWTVFQPLLLENVTAAMLKRIIAIIERNRPIGVLMVAPFAFPPAQYAEFPWPPEVEVDIIVTRGAIADRRGGILSVSLVLSDEVQQFIDWQTVYFGIVPVSAYAESTMFTAQRRWDHVRWLHEKWDAHRIEEQALNY